MAVCEHFFDSHDALLDTLTSRIERCLQRDIDERERATLLVSGGSTPIPLFDALAGADLPWRQVSCALVDERWVPEDHTASNAALVRNHLLQGKAARARFERTFLADVTVEERVAALNQRAFWRDLVPTVAIIGMGGDLHTASIFPGAAHTLAALAKDAPALLHTYPTGTPGNPPFDRVTLSARVLAGARELVLLLRGADKMERYEYARSLSIDDAPNAPIVALLADPAVRVEVYASP